MSFLPTMLCMLQRRRYRPALGRGNSLSSANRFWQAGVTSPGDCQPGSPAPGMTGTQPQALVGQSVRKRPLTNLCRHPSVSPHDTLTVNTHYVSLQRSKSLESTSVLYLAWAGLPDSKVLSLSSINTVLWVDLIQKILKSERPIPVNLSLEQGEMQKGDCRELWQLLKVVT